MLRYGPNNMHLFNISEVKWLPKQIFPIHQVLKLQQIFLTSKDTDTFTLHILKFSLGWQQNAIRNNFIYKPWEL